MLLCYCVLTDLVNSFLVLGVYSSVLCCRCPELDENKHGDAHPLVSLIDHDR